MMFNNNVCVFIIFASVSTFASRYPADSECGTRADYECDDGSCVNGVRICDGQKDCTDGGDEFGCKTQMNVTYISSSPLQHNCIIPPYPDHGNYSTLNRKFVRPGEAYNAVFINVTCENGYQVVGSSAVHCLEGFWSGEIPECLVQCRLIPHESVKYDCLIFGAGGGFLPCSEYLPSGTVVRSTCRRPEYFSPTAIPFMQCINGNWDFIAKCLPDCGTITPDSSSLVVDGQLVTPGALPWHAGIYVKNRKMFRQICAGSLISPKIVLSAAQCFWSDTVGKLPPDIFAVSVGLVSPQWGNQFAQTQNSDVEDTYMPSDFDGSASFYEADIAVVLLMQVFKYSDYIKPVCVDFDVYFEKKQLQSGKHGLVGSWNLKAESDSNLDILQVTELPFISNKKCISQTPDWLLRYLTGDKICAGFLNSSMLCAGNVGGGLAFPDVDRDVERYYLRGIVSTAPNNKDICNANTYTKFTSVLPHKDLIKKVWDNEETTL